jgi:hypothetical protein
MRADAFFQQPEAGGKQPASFFSSGAAASGAFVVPRD